MTKNPPKQAKSPLSEDKGKPSASDCLGTLLNYYTLKELRDELDWYDRNSLGK